jgi:hypothetical protein|tara:strand:+ start:6371 stop:7204 length:834 start_codon:yes stop_codon:yes gene_type:complete
VSVLAEVTGKAHLSLSALKSYSTCGEQYRLERIVGVETDSSWALFGGKVFHTATEYLDLMKFLSPELAVEDAWKYEEQSVDTDKLRPGGRNKVENGEWWTEKLLVFLQQYLQWRDARFENGWMWLDLGDGRPAIEFEVRGTLGGVPVLGYVDRAMVSPDGEVHIYDLKTGARSNSREQLDVYGSLLRQAYGITASHGSYYMARKGNTDEMFLLSTENPQLDAWWQESARGIEAEVFLPNPSSPFCGICQVKPYCRLKGDPSAIASFDTKKRQKKESE